MGMMLELGRGIGIVGLEEPDQTLEILMSDLEKSVMDIFTRKECKSAEEATLVRKIVRIRFKILIVIINFILINLNRNPGSIA